MSLHAVILCAPQRFCTSQALHVGGDGGRMSSFMSASRGFVALTSVRLPVLSSAGWINGKLLQRVRFLCGPAGGRMDWVALIGWEQQGSPSSKVTASLVVGRTLACYSLPWTNIRVQNKSRGKQKQQQREGGINHILVFFRLRLCILFFKAALNNDFNDFWQFSSAVWNI